MINRALVKILLPLVRSWCEEQEQVILRDGVALTPAQLTDARTIGVASPEKVRLLKVAAVPTPTNPLVVAAIKRVQTEYAITKGLTLRYGIFIRADCWGERDLVFHELVHTLQYERMGGFREFLHQYLSECLSVGYPAAPLEQEAIITTARRCR